MTFTDVTPNLIVADIDRSTAFYRDVLGFSVVTTVPDAARVVMPLKDQFYGRREFGIEDPDGYIIFFAQRIG